MPALQGGTDEDTYETFIEEMVENGHYDSQSDALEFCVKYTLIHKYKKDV